MCRKHPEDEDQKNNNQHKQACLVARDVDAFLQLCLSRFWCFVVVVVLGQSCCLQARQPQPWWASISATPRRLRTFSSGEFVSRTHPSFTAARQPTAEFNPVFEVPSRQSFCSYQCCRPLSALTPGNSSCPFSRRSGSWWGPSSWRRTSLKRSRVSDERNGNMMKKTTRWASLLFVFLKHISHISFHTNFHCWFVLSCSIFIHWHKEQGNMTKPAGWCAELVLTLSVKHPQYSIIIVNTSQCNIIAMWLMLQCAMWLLSFHHRPTLGEHCETVSTWHLLVDWKVNGVDYFLKTKLLDKKKNQYLIGFNG